MVGFVMMQKQDVARGEEKGEEEKREVGGGKWECGVSEHSGQCKC